MRENDVSLPDSKGKPKLFYGYITVLAAFFIMVILHAGIYSYGVFFKPMSEDFGWPRAVTSSAFSTAMFVTAILFLFTGRLSDRFGPRVVNSVGGLLFGLGFLLMSRVNALWQIFIFWGLLMGIGNASGFVPLTSMVARWFVRRRAVMTGVVVAGVGVGTMIGPPMASQLIINQGWRMSYLLMGSAFVVLFVLAAQFLRRDPATMGQLPYGSEVAGKGAPSQGVGGLSFRESIRTVQFWMIFITYVFFGISQMAVMVHLVPNITDQGVSPGTAAGIMTLVGAFSIAGRVIFGGAGDKSGYRRALVIGLSVLSASLFLLLVAREAWTFYVFAGVFGFSYGGEVALLAPLVAEMFGLGALGATLGVITFGYAFGCAVGPLLAGAIFDTSGSYYSAFLVGAILMIVGLVLVLRLRPIRGKAPATLT